MGQPNIFGVGPVNGAGTITLNQSVTITYAIEK